MLSPEQVGSYREQGFLLVKGVLSKAEAAEIHIADRARLTENDAAVRLWDG